MVQYPNQQPPTTDCGRWPADRKMAPFLPFLFLIFVNTQIAVYAQDTAWVRRYNGPGNGTDVARAIAVDNSGNAFVTGGSTGSGTGCDYATIKYNSSGDSVWAVRYSYTNYGDSAWAIAVDKSGNVYVTGSSYGSSGTDMDYATIKYDSLGNQKWVARYNYANGADYARAIAVDSSGNVFVTGYSYGTYYDYATIKYNSAGVQQWVRRYDGPRQRNDYAYAIAVDTFGNVYVAGCSESSGTYLDYTTIKYGPNGETLWVKRYNGPGNGNDYCYALAVDNSGNVYVTGGSTGSGSGYDYATIKYNSNGDTLWVRRYNGPGNWEDYAYAIALDRWGNVYLTGASTGSNTLMDYATVRYKPNGDTAWIRKYDGGNGDDYAYAIAVDDTVRNLYVTGMSKGSGTGYDYATLKYRLEGSQQWVGRYDRAKKDDKAYAIALDYSGGVYVTGYSDSASNYDYLTIKYTPPVGIEEPELDSHTPFTFEIYPNIFLSQATIHYSLLEAGKVSLRVFEVSGKLVKTVVDEYKEPGVYTVSWDGRDERGRKIPAGVYFWTLKANGASVKRKILLLR